MSIITIASGTAQKQAAAPSRIPVTAIGDTLKIDDHFVAMPIPDDVFERMQGKSYKKNCPIPRSQLRYLRVLISDGKGHHQQGEMVVNKLIARDVLEILYQLYQADYAIERMELVDNYDADDERSMAANNSSAFNYRTVAGTKRLSKHAMGMAIDINPLYNPLVKGVGTTLKVSPVDAAPYADRTKTFRHKITRSDLAYKLFRQYGFSWGGNWRRYKDWQHFQK